MVCIFIFHCVTVQAENSQEEITLALRCLCDTRALRARRDYKPRGSALREELTDFSGKFHSVSSVVKER